MSGPADPLECPDCDEPIFGDTQQERADYYRDHLGTLGHKVAALGEAGRDLRRVLDEKRDAMLRKLGRIP